MARTVNPVTLMRKDRMGDTELYRYPPSFLHLLPSSSHFMIDREFPCPDTRNRLIFTSKSDEDLTPTWVVGTL